MAGAGGGAAAATVQPAAPGAGAGAGAGRSSSSSAGGAGGGGVVDPRAEALRCPRCDSANTKFCYYNNYSLTQPRHFCKACKRYWTRGGTLRNVPVGGGCRKNKRSRSGNGGGRPGGSCAVAAGGASSNAPGGGLASSTSSMSMSLQPPGSLSSALGLHGHGGSSLASLLLGSGGDHLGLFHAMQSAVSDATAYEMQQQQHQSQVDQLLGLGYGANGSQIQMKPWQQHFQDGAAGLFDGFYAPLLSGSIVPGLEELHVKAEATAGEQHNHQEKKAADGEQTWDQQTTPSSNVEANIMASDALMAAAAAASMNPAVSNAATAPTSSSLMYWGNGGIGGSPAPWPDMANCGSSIATFF